MSKRHDNKRAAFEARDMRRYLVAEAGSSDRIAWRLGAAEYQGDSWYRENCRHSGVAKPRRVSVPRSLRPILGRYLGQ